MNREENIVFFSERNNEDIEIIQSIKWKQKQKMKNVRKEKKKIIENDKWKQTKKKKKTNTVYS